MSLVCLGIQLLCHLELAIVQTITIKMEELRLEDLRVSAKLMKLLLRRKRNLLLVWKGLYILCKMVQILDIQAFVKIDINKIIEKYDLKIAAVQ